MSEQNSFIGNISNKVIYDVSKERKRQVEVEGYTAEVDDRGEGGRLAAAAACYSVHAAFSLFEGPGGTGLVGVPVWWPFDAGSWKPKTERENLVRAAALIIAEIEKMDRASGVREAVSGVPETGIDSEKNSP
jgi:hypothetical protein